MRTPPDRTAASFSSWSKEITFCPGLPDCAEAGNNIGCSEVEVADAVAAFTGANSFVSFITTACASAFAPE
jgi:hypothetical protein